MDTTRAIIIRSETSGEADILITAYTEAFGKQNFVARGGRKMEAIFISRTIFCQREEQFFIDRSKDH